jgi:elongation factor G
VLRMQAARREDLDVAAAGEIVALTGLRGASTGDTVCAPSAPVALEAMAFPEPVVSVVVEARSRADVQRLAETLARLTTEDPTLRVRTHPETGQTLLSGMGELHLQMRLDRMAREFGLHVAVGAPQVALRETVRRAAVHRYRLKRQRGGLGQFAEVELSLEPTGRFQDADGPTVEFVDEVRGGTVPSEFIPAVEAGVRAAAAEGALAGYPVVGVRVALRDGAFHDKDRSAMAFQAAGAQGFKAAARAAGLVLLEPVADVEVTTPAAHVGDVIADLSRRRGRIGAMEAQRGATVVRAQVPLAELFGYADDLRSLSHGRATFTQRHGTYAEAPG